MPAVPYYRYLKDVYQSTAQEMPGSLHPNIVKAVAKKWKELHREGRTKYVEAFTLEKEQRAAEMVRSSEVSLLLWLKKTIIKKMTDTN